MTARRRGGGRERARLVWTPNYNSLLPVSSSITYITERIVLHADWNIQCEAKVWTIPVQFGMDKDRKIKLGKT